MRSGLLQNYWNTTVWPVESSQKADPPAAMPAPATRSSSAAPASADLLTSLDVLTGLDLPLPL